MYISEQDSLVSRHREGGGVPGTHCLHMQWNCGNRVRTCTYWWHCKLTVLMCQLVFCCLYRTVLCLLVPQDKAQEWTSCLQWVYLSTLWGYPPISVSPFLPLPTRHFSLYVPDNIKSLGRVCSSNVYSVLRTKAEIIFMKVYAIHMNRWSSCYYMPLILPCGLCYKYKHAQTVCTRRSFSPSFTPGNKAKHPIATLTPKIDEIFWCTFQNMLALSMC